MGRKSRSSLLLLGCVFSLLGMVIREVDGLYCCFCKEMCEKYRSGSGSYTLDCDFHRDDPDCNRHCFFCESEGICDNSQSHKVYHCPAEEKDEATEMAQASGMISVIVGCVVLLLICGCGIAGCVYCAARNRNRGVGVGAPMMYGGGAMAGPTAMPYTTGYNYQTTAPMPVTTVPLSSPTTDPVSAQNQQTNEKI